MIKNANTKELIERIFFGLIFGGSVPLLNALMALWISFMFTSNEKTIMIATFSGLAAGIVISLIIWILIKPDVYNLPRAILVLTYLFYNVCIFGFFMGVPVFNVIPGFIAGYYWVKRKANRGEVTEVEKDIRTVPVFTASIMFLVCVVSAAIALSSKSTPDDLKGTLHLNFEITIPMVIILIMTGGTGLVLMEYFITRFIMRKTLTHVSR